MDGMLLAEMEYSGWNNLIAARLFNPEMAERRVYLSASQELINELGKGHGVGYADFIEAVKRGPEDVYVGGLCEKAQQLFRHWRRKHSPFPPYLGYLDLLRSGGWLEGQFCRPCILSEAAKASRRRAGDRDVSSLRPYEIPVGGFGKMVASRSKRGIRHF